MGKNFNDVNGGQQSTLKTPLAMPLFIINHYFKRTSDPRVVNH